jgi:hypothetical protein
MAALLALDPLRPQLALDPAPPLSIGGRSRLRGELPLFEHETRYEPDEEEPERRVLVVELQHLLA